MQHETAQSNTEKKKGWRKSRFFARRMAATNGQQLEPQQAPASASWTISQSLKAVSLATFRRCLLEEDWRHLVTAGNPPQDAIDAAGFALYSDYAQKVGGNRMAVLVERSRSIQAIASRYDRMQLIIGASRQVRDPRLIDEFRAEGFRSEAKRMEAADDAEYGRILDRIESLMKADLLKLERMVKDQPKKAKELSPEDVDQDFEDTIISIGEVLQIRVIETEDSVYRYCGYVNRLRQKIESQNRQAMVGKKH